MRSIALRGFQAVDSGAAAKVVGLEKANVLGIGGFNLQILEELLATDVQRAKLKATTSECGFVNESMVCRAEAEGAKLG